MAVLSRPSLRSSVRRNAVVESPATEDVRRPLHSRRGKRNRDLSPGNESNTSSKKLKPRAEVTVRRVAKSLSQTFESLPIRDRQPAIENAVTRVVRSRKPDPVLVQAATNGFSHHIHNGINQNLPPIAHQLDRRSLRSHDGGSRSKSELAPYFSNYEELISIGPKEPGTLDIFKICLEPVLTQPDFPIPETILHISDDPTKSISASRLSSPRIKITNRGRPPSRHLITAPISFKTIQWPEETFTTLNDAARIDLSTLNRQTKKTNKDPLADSTYLKVHAREERKEKQLHNIERERATHEKFQLERLLDGLKGHDWLRIMGISGITDSAKKAYEPKRDYLISEVQLLLKKFRIWKEIEKRRKTEKEELTEEAGDGEIEEENRDSGEGDGDSDEGDAGEETGKAEQVSSDASGGDSTDFSELDASAARQLRLEAILASKPRLAPSPPKGPSKHPPPTPPPVEQPFTSFYKKPYMRAAAIGKHRRSERSRTAFGQPLPNPEQRPFELPPEVRTAEAMLESGRRMRRSNREGRDL
ncbi:MAG: hypothetical protein Q9163_005759 [Psora crenata]